MKGRGHSIKAHKAIPMIMLGSSRGVDGGGACGPFALMRQDLLSLQYIISVDLGSALTDY
jgi:hypothetical protein